MEILIVDDEGNIRRLLRALLESEGYQVREADTAQNLIDAYLGWRRAIARLQRMTFYDFERDVPVLERFNIAIPQRR